jgi:hypothetical protein
VTPPLCILHAGTEKTGTTSLQRFLSMNSANLADQGIWVPRSLAPDPVAGPYNHLLLSTASHLSISEPDDLQLQLGLSSMEAVRQHRQDVIDALTTERDALPYEPATMIVSSEHVHSRLRTEEDVAYAKELLEPLCRDFRVVVYLRSQYELAQSVAVTAVRQGACEFRPIPDFRTANGFDDLIGVDHEYFDYEQFLRRLERVFGQQLLDVRLYEHLDLHHNDIVEDFFYRLGADTAHMQHPGRENSSLRQDAILFLLKLNKYLQGRPNAASLRASVLAHLALTHHGAAQQATGAELTRFMSQFANSNEFVRSRWFPERTTLFADPMIDENRTDGQLVLSESDAFGFFIELLGGENQSL